MSICRFAKEGSPTGWHGELTVTKEQASDVYMYEHVGGYIVCQYCLLGGSAEFEQWTRPGVKIESYAEAYKHLLAHKQAGHAVPQFAIDAMKQSVERGDSLQDTAHFDGIPFKTNQ